MVFMGKKELKKLLDGNRNFVNGTPFAQNKTMETLHKFANFQNPHAIVLSCSDSRVVPEIIFDVGIGELFVVRTAGITIGANVLESIEFGVKELNIPLLMLLGHDDCGVMKFAMSDDEDTNLFPVLISHVHSVMGNEKTPRELARKYTLADKNLILERSKIIREAHKKGDLMIVCAHFHFDSGLVELL